MVLNDKMLFVLFSVAESATYMYQAFGSFSFVKSVCIDFTLIKRHDVGSFQKYTSLQLKLLACVYHKYAKRQCYISF